MITRVQVKNFRNLADIDVQLGPLTVLVGRNGTGKSAFLDALRFVRDALHMGLNTAISQRGGVRAISRWSPSGKHFPIEINLELLDEKFEALYTVTVSTGREDKQRVKHELCRLIPLHGQATAFETRNGKWVTTLSGNLTHPPSAASMPISPDELMLPFAANLDGRLAPLRRHILSTKYYSIFPNTLRTPQRRTSETVLLEDGSNLATTLLMIKKMGITFPELVTSLGYITEGANDLRVFEAGGYLVTEVKHEAQKTRSPWFPLAQESDGTLRVLAILTALYQTTAISTLAVEEPELSVHPGALAVLSDVIKEAATRSQVIITTQSPDLISHFRADELRVVERVDGQTRIGPIDEVQRETINDQLFSAGDLLRIEGLHVASQEETVAAHA